MHTCQKACWLITVGTILMSGCAAPNPSAAPASIQAVTQTIAANNTPTQTVEADRFAASKNCKTVGVLLPDTVSSTRWDTKDRPMLDRSLKTEIPDVNILFANAQGDADTQQTQAGEMLSRGACILIVTPVDSQKAAIIVQLSAQKGVPVIAYDRLIQSDELCFYVSFDNIMVGELQGEWIAAHAKPGDKVVMLNGAPTDHNSSLFYQGAMSKLQPLFDSGTLKLIFELSTPNWNKEVAQTGIEQTLTANNNDVQVLYAANDELADAVVASLRKHKLAGKILVTGQDASSVGIRNILLGHQGMTVYKPFAQSAMAAAILAGAMSRGDDMKTMTSEVTQTQSGKEIQSVLLKPLAVTKDNLNVTVIQDGFVNLNEVCAGLPPKSGGVCP